MIKGMGKTEDGQMLIVVGLTSENVNRLMGGKPIRALYPDGSTVIVMYGETAEDLTEDLRALGLLKTSPLRPSSQ
jgi:hypothetical protein